MVPRRRCSAEYKRKAVAMLVAPGVRVSQIAAELGSGASILGHWRRELRQEPAQAFPGHGRPREEELGHLRWELARVTKERIFCEKRPRASRARRDDVSDDPTMPRGLSHPPDVPVVAGLAQWVLWLGDSAAEWAGSGERPITHTDSSPPCGGGWRHRQSAGVGRSAVCRRAVWPPPRGVLDAPGWTAGRTATAGVAEEAFWNPSKWDAESSGPKLPCGSPQYQMGDRYHLHSDRRAQGVSLCRAGFIFRSGRRVVDESAAGSPARRSSGTDGALAAASQDPGHSPFGSGLSVYLRGIPTVSRSAPGDL
jgi:transposase